MRSRALRHCPSPSALESLAPDIKGDPAVLVGTVWPDGDKLYNAVALIEDGETRDRRIVEAQEGDGAFLGSIPQDEDLVASFSGTVRKSAEP